MKQQKTAIIKIALKMGYSASQILEVHPVNILEIKKVCKRMQSHCKKTARHPRNRNKDCRYYLARYDWASVNK
jgi:hypothetical protein